MESLCMSRKEKSREELAKVAGAESGAQVQQAEGG